MKIINDQEALEEAIIKHNIELAKFLIENKIDVNLLDKEGFSPLYNAIFHKVPMEICKLLINAGADVNHIASVLNYSIEESGSEEISLNIWSQIKYYSSDELVVEELAREVFKTGKLLPQKDDSFYNKIKFQVEFEQDCDEVIELEFDALIDKKIIKNIIEKCGNPKNNPDSNQLFLNATLEKLMNELERLIGIWMKMASVECIDSLCLAIIDLDDHLNQIPKINGEDSSDE